MDRKNKIEKYLFAGIKILAVLTLFTPLVLGPFGLSFSEYPKTVYFRILVEIMVILWAISMIFSAPLRLAKQGEGEQSRAPNSEPPYLRITPLTTATLTFFAVQNISALLGFNIIRSFFGMLEVGGGLITQFHYLAFFLILSSVFRERKDWALFFKGAVLVSLLSALAGFLQRFFKVGFYGVAAQAERISGTLSNPVYFGFFTAMAVFLGLYLVATEKNKKEKIFWGAAVFINIIAIFLSGTRGAFLGLGAGLGIVAALSFFSLVPSASPWRKRILFGLLALTIGASGAIFFLVKYLPYQPGASPFTTRIVDTFNLTAAFEGRYPGWEAAIRAWRDRPVFGWGPASFGYLYDKYFDAHFVDHINAYYVFQDAHNKILNLMAESGIMGAGSWIAIYVILFAALWRRRNPASLQDKGAEQGKNLIGTYVLFGFFANHFVQNLFVFDTASTYMLFFLAAAFVNNYYFAQGRFGTFDFGRLWSVIAILFIFVSLAAFYFVNVKPALAGYDFVRGFFAEKKDYAESIALYQRGSGRGTPYDRELRLLFASRSVNAIEQSSAGNRQKEALESLVKLRELLSPELGKPEFRYLELYRIVAGINEWLYLETRDEAALREAERIMKEANAFNDQWLSHHYFLGRYAIYQGRYEEGENHFRKGLKLSRRGGLLPEDIITFFRSAGVAYWRAAVLQNSQELRQRAAANFYMASRLTIAQRRSLTEEQRRTTPASAVKSDVNFIQQTINLLMALGQKEAAAKLFQEAKEVYGGPEK